MRKDEQRRLVFGIGEICPYTTCEFREDQGGPNSMCAGAHAAREKTFLCDLEALKKCYVKKEGKK